MTATLNVNSSPKFAIDLGGERIAPSVLEHQLATLVGERHDVTFIVVGVSSSPSFVTLWDSSNFNVDDFKWGVLLVDPDGERSDAQEIDVRTTINAIVQTERRNKYGCKVFGPSAQSSGATTKIEVAPLNASNGKDVKVRLLLLR